MLRRPRVVLQSLPRVSAPQSAPHTPRPRACPVSFVAQAPQRGSESSLLGRRSSVTPAASAGEDERPPLMRSVCGTPAEVAWALAADRVLSRRAHVCGASCVKHSLRPLRPAAAMGGGIVTVSNESCWACVHGWVA